MNCRYPFINIPLSYPYHALEPYIDAKTMKIHHEKHLQGYIDNLNLLLKENPILQKYSLRELLVSTDKIPAKLQTSIQNNAGGVYNHRFFFDGIAPANQPLNSRKFLNKAEQQFHGLKEMRAELKSAALSVFGSGYAWLVYEKGTIKIITTANQNTPVLEHCTPLLNIDVWEHAYYLKHYNIRADYLDCFFHVINWNRVEQRYLRAAKPSFITR